MDQKKIRRINELYKKSKTTGLTEEERMEQQSPRTEYRMSIINNLSASLDHVSIQTPTVPLQKLRKKRTLTWI